MKKKSSKSPTSRTLDKLRKFGCCAGVVERFNRFAGPFGKRQDLFGCIDLIAIRPGRIIGIQATNQSNHSSHVVKALAEPRLRLWLEAGGGYEIWSWAKKGPKDKKRWDVRIQKITLKDYDDGQIR